MNGCRPAVDRRSRTIRFKLIAKWIDEGRDTGWIECDAADHGDEPAGLGGQRIGRRDDGKTR